MTLPLWAIRELTQPYGARLPERQKKARLGPVVANTSFFRDAWMKDGKPVPGNLANQDYEFWAGTVYTEWAQCRWCLQGCNTVDLRKEHFKNNECASKLKAAIKLLQRDSKCAVCDTVTKHRVWGVPLCTPKCVAAWKFEAYHQSFRDAKAVVDPQYYRVGFH